MLPSPRRALQALAQENRSVEAGIRRIAALVGYDLTRITRRAYGGACRALIQSLDPSALDVVEISAGDNVDWRGFGYRSYRTLEWPDFDLCAEPVAPDLRASCDLVIADQVLEHLLWPLRGARNLHALLRPGGYALVMTPFLLRVHSGPYDCSRWTETGMRHLLAEAGFPIADIRTWCYGNRGVARQLLTTWPRMGWRRALPPHDPNYPVVIWALARRAP